MEAGILRNNTEVRGWGARAKPGDGLGCGEKMVAKAAWVMQGHPAGWNRHQAPRAFLE